MTTPLFGSGLLDPYGNPLVGGGTTSAPGGFLSDFLETQPEIPYSGAIYGRNLTPNQLQHFQGQRTNVFNQYLAQINSQVQQGMLPTDRFQDFLGGFDFNREYGKVFRGGMEQFAPPVRVLR